MPKLPPMLLTLAAAALLGLSALALAGGEVISEARFEVHSTRDGDHTVVSREITITSGRVHLWQRSVNAGQVRTVLKSLDGRRDYSFATDGSHQVAPGRYEHHANGSIGGAGYIKSRLRFGGSVDR